MCFPCVCVCVCVFNRYLSPAGEYNLRLGVMKELNPDMVATYQGDAKALEGHAFIVEAAVSIGGKDPTIEQNQLNVFRFANRIPLLFEQGNDVIPKTAQALKWNKYVLPADPPPPSLPLHPLRSDQEERERSGQMMKRKSAKNADSAD